MTYQTMEQIQALPLVLTPAEAADVLRCTPRHVRYMCARGYLRNTKLGREWRISRDSVIEFAGLAETTGIS